MTASGACDVKSFTLCCQGLGSVGDFAPKPGEIVRIGRSTDCDVTIGCQGISKVHVELMVIRDQDDVLRLSAKNTSKNGTGIRHDQTDSNFYRMSDKDMYQLKHGSQLIIPMRHKRICCQEAKQIVTTIKFPAKSKSQGLLAKDESQETQRQASQTRVGDRKLLRTKVEHSSCRTQTQIPEVDSHGLSEPLDSLMSSRMAPAVPPCSQGSTLLAPAVPHFSQDSSDNRRTRPEEKQAPSTSKDHKVNAAADSQRHACENWVKLESPSFSLVKALEPQVTRNEKCTVAQTVSQSKPRQPSRQVFLASQGCSVTLKTNKYHTVSETPDTLPLSPSRNLRAGDCLETADTMPLPGSLVKQNSSESVVLTKQPSCESIAETLVVPDSGSDEGELAGSLESRFKENVSGQSSRRSKEIGKTKRALSAWQSPAYHDDTKLANVKRSPRLRQASDDHHSILPKSKKYPVSDQRTFSQKSNLAKADAGSGRQLCERRSSRLVVPPQSAAETQMPATLIDPDTQLADSQHTGKWKIEMPATLIDPDTQMVDSQHSHIARRKKEAMPATLIDPDTQVADSQQSCSAQSHQSSTDPTLVGLTGAWDATLISTRSKHPSMEPTQIGQTGAWAPTLKRSVSDTMSQPTQVDSHCSNKKLSHPSRTGAVEATLIVESQLSVLRTAELGNVHCATVTRDISPSSPAQHPNGPGNQGIAQNSRASQSSPMVLPHDSHPVVATIDSKTLSLPVQSIERPAKVHDQIRFQIDKQASASRSRSSSPEMKNEGSDESPDWEDALDDGVESRSPSPKSAVSSRGGKATGSFNSQDEEDVENEAPPLQRRRVAGGASAFASSSSTHPHESLSKQQDTISTYSPNRSRSPVRRRRPETKYPQSRQHSRSPILRPSHKICENECATQRREVSRNCANSADGEDAQPLEKEQEPQSPHQRERSRWPMKRSRSPMKRKIGGEAKGKNQPATPVDSAQKRDDSSTKEKRDTSVPRRLRTCSPTGWFARSPSPLSREEKERKPLRRLRRDQSSAPSACLSTLDQNENRTSLVHKKAAAFEQRSFISTPPPPPPPPPSQVSYRSEKLEGQRSWRPRRYKR